MRPAVGDDVVDVGQQHVLVRRPSAQQRSSARSSGSRARSNGRAASRRARRRRSASRAAASAGRRGRRPAARRATGGRRPGPAAPSAWPKRRAQRLVAPDDLGRARARAPARRARRSTRMRGGDVVGGAAGLELIRNQSRCWREGQGSGPAGGGAGWTGPDAARRRLSDRSTTPLCRRDDGRSERRSRAPRSAAKGWYRAWGFAPVTWRAPRPRAPRRRATVPPAPAAGPRSWRRALPGSGSRTGRATAVRAERLPDADDHLGGEQRVPAQREEVVVRADPLDPQHLGPDRRPAAPRPACAAPPGAGVGAAGSGAGRARRSTLPFGVSGSAASATNADGTM